MVHNLFKFYLLSKLQIQLLFQTGCKWKLPDNRVFLRIQFLQMYAAKIMFSTCSGSYLNFLKKQYDSLH